MTTDEKIAWLIDHVCSLHIDVNDHRSVYKTVEAFVADSRCCRDMSDDERAECIKRDRLVIVQCYLLTPVGSVTVVHWDIGQAIDRVYEFARQEKSECGTWG